MISRISGKVIEKCANSLIVDTGGICYEVLIPAMVMERIQESIDSDGRITLVTFHYLQVEPSKTFPVLVGFANDVERSFFEVFIPSLRMFSALLIRFPGPICSLFMASSYDDCS